MVTMRALRARSEGGASLVEYALLISMLALAAFLAFHFFGNSVGGGMDRSVEQIKVVTATSAPPAP